MAERKQEIEAAGTPSAAQRFASVDVALSKLMLIGNRGSSLCGVIDGAKPGDIYVGQGTDDAGSVLVRPSAKSGDEPVRLYVLDEKTLLSYTYGGPAGMWDDGDPSTPAEATKRTYCYTVYAPEADGDYPVRLFVGQNQASVRLNTALDKHAGALHDLCFGLTTVVRSGKGNTWHGPVFTRLEPADEELKAAADMFANFVRPPVAEHAAGLSPAAPGF